MAGKRKRANGTWEYVFKKAGLLDKPIYMTFSNEAEGDAYASRLESLLQRGIIPTEHQVDGRVITIADLDREYQRAAHPSPKDVSALSVVVRTKGKTRLSSIDAAWVDEWITTMKQVDHLAPSTIRSRVGALARCTDWGMRKRYLQMPDHPFRTLPDGYSQYTKEDAAVAGGVRIDTERDRRLERGEHERILAVIATGVLPRKQRPYELPDSEALRCLYILATESAMRLREMYTLTMAQVDLDKKTVFLEKTKNGSKRQVPLSSVALKELTAHTKLHNFKPEDLIFPWWNGNTSLKELHNCTDFLSNLFKEIFDTAKCPGLGFHDLRHEAISRLFERTKLSEARIMKITGHKSQRMLMRYANLRGSDLADSLW